MSNASSTTKTAKDYADEKQANLYKMFPQDSFLGNKTNVEHAIEWITFFRQNLNRFVSDYLGIKLYWYQMIAIYLMGICQFICIIASRATAKSFLVALYACCRCILYPHSQIVLVSGTRGQSKLIVSEKIEKELMSMSPALRKEIKSVKKNQYESVVEFRNSSMITVVTANDNSRGYRSTCIVRDEFRQIKKSVDDGILSPFQIARQPAYMTDSYYANIQDLLEEPVDIYISSSWMDNGHWMWGIVDKAYSEMLDGKQSCLLAFDESVALKHHIKTQHYFQSEKKKQDPVTWELEFMNTRLKQNFSAFFQYNMLDECRTNRKPFYPLSNIDYLSHKKNKYAIPKQQDEIRIVSCDMAFVENAKNDNSIFTCGRLLPQTKTYSTGDGNELKVDNGYHIIISYITSIQGGDITKQALMIRRLYEDFKADYICLDVRNSGIAVLDILEKVMYDPERECEYTPLTCMNDESLAQRNNTPGAEPRIFAISANQKMNSDIALTFRRYLSEKRIEFLPTFEYAEESILPKIHEYIASPSADVQSFYEAPFLETQALFSETSDLVAEKNPQNGVITVKELPGKRKDRYSSCSYLVWMASTLERNMSNQSNDYAYSAFYN